ncbi:NADH:flavin oxidoreductase/NADH oxidase-like protein [Xylariaceae sp. AK1471]|nr:NADH:flavin oxidoreductase/NADH oxidase-like protein [Xylariaceae sp. AK1471]
MPALRYESDPVDVSPLAKPLKFEFSGRTAKNRFFKAAMAEGLATWDPTNIEARGIPTKELIELYRRWGENEWGVITTGNMDIEFDMLDAIGDMIVTPECPPSGPRFEAFKELAAAAKAHGSLFLAQVTHPGRQLSARIRKDTISASALQIPPSPGSVVSNYAKPRAATKEDIARLVDGFSHAAEYLQKAGFDGIELHGAHGYLISQFLSQLSNQRTDEYGGSIENRLRLVIEIAEAIRRRTRPGFVLGIKINSVEFQEKGMQPAEVRLMCEALQEAGFDFVELSGGNHQDIGFGGERESTRKREAYFLEFVRDIVPNLTRTRKFLVGGFRTAASMVHALDESLDGISLGRPAAQEPRFPTEILAGKVTGAVKPPYEVIAGVVLGLTVSGSQMLQIGRGLEPFDASDEKAMAAFKEALAAHSVKLAADGYKLVVHGPPELTAPETSSRRYGDAY